MVYETKLSVIWELVECLNDSDSYDSFRKNMYAKLLGIEKELTAGAQPPSAQASDGRKKPD